MTSNREKQGYKRNTKTVTKYGKILVRNVLQKNAVIQKMLTKQILQVIFHTSMIRNEVVISD